MPAQSQAPGTAVLPARHRSLTARVRRIPHWPQNPRPRLKYRDCGERVATNHWQRRTPRPCLDGREPTRQAPMARRSPHRPPATRPRLMNWGCGCHRPKQHCQGLVLAGHAQQHGQQALHRSQVIRQRRQTVTAETWPGLPSAPSTDPTSNPGPQHFGSWS